MCPYGGQQQEQRVIDPYAILNVSKDASDGTIQGSYKNLSRNFHPDKQPPGPSRDAAQEVFVSFKNAHEILTDPVLRQVYDDNGYDAVRIVKMTMHSPDSEALYPTLLTFHQLGQTKKARYHMEKALEETTVERADHTVQIRTTMEFPCSTQATAFLGEGEEPIDIPELSEASISVSASAASDSKWDMSVATSTEVNKGKGNASGTVSVGYKPQQGTQINGSLELTNPMRASLGTTRTLANGTMVTTSARAFANSRKLALSLVSHRNLWRNQLRGTWVLGIGSDLQMHYGMLSLSTLSDEYPRCTAKVNLGMNQYPLKVSAKQDFEGDSRTWYLSVAWGVSGMEYKALLSRAVASYAQVSMGVKHATHSGLTWLLEAERGDFTFRVPVSISSITSPGYMYKLLYLSLITAVFDAAIGDVIHDSTKDLLQADESTDKTVDSSFEVQKSKEAAEQQLALMRGAAVRNREREHQVNGLVVYEARYFVDQGPSIDVTTQLQFWVKDGALRLPSGSKSQLMGFYQLVKQPPRQSLSILRRWLTAEVPYDESSIPQLRVRFASGDKTYEITIYDNDELTLPSSGATLLGPRDTVH